MQFYSWQKFNPVGSPMVEPKWIQWDPDVTVAALAYADSLVLCRARPPFKPIASLSIQVHTCFLTECMALLVECKEPGWFSDYMIKNKFIAKHLVWRVVSEVLILTDEYNLVTSFLPDGQGTGMCPSKAWLLLWILPSCVDWLLASKLYSWSITTCKPPLLMCCRCYGVHHVQAQQ